MAIGKEQDYLERASNLLSHYVIPLYLDDAGQLPVQVGTGFLVSFEEKIYLITAAHVLDLRSQNELYFYSAPNELTTVAGKVCQSGKGLERKHDDIDVAVVQLLPEVPKPPYRGIEKLAFEPYQLRPRLLPRTGRQYLMLGFPATKNKFRRVHNEVRAKAYAYHNGSPEISEYQALGLSDERHLLIHFDQRIGFDGDGNHIDFPKPQGMSGGPILLYHSDQPEEFRFGFPVVAVATTHKKLRKLIQATDISIALQFIAELHYDL